MRRDARGAGSISVDARYSTVAVTPLEYLHMDGYRTTFQPPSILRMALSVVTGVSGIWVLDGR
jgi:hypothetical protein